MYAQAMAWSRSIARIMFGRYMLIRYTLRSCFVLPGTSRWTEIAFREIYKSASH